MGNEMQLQIIWILVNKLNFFPAGLLLCSYKLTENPQPSEQSDGHQQRSALAPRGSNPSSGELDVII